MMQTDSAGRHRDRCMPTRTLGRTLAPIAAALVLAPAGAGAQQVELSFWTNLTTASTTNVIQRQVSEFIANKPNVKVNFETVPQNVMYTRLITALKRGEAPNVMNTL